MSIHWFEGLNTLPWNVHIAIVAGEYPPRWGGIGSVVYHLAKHFVDIGHEVSIITRKHSSAIPSQEGVKVIQVPWTPLPMAFTRSYGKNAKRALVKLHEKRPIDVIHAHLPLVSWTRREFRYLQRKIAPIVSSLHGSWLGEREGIRRAAYAKESAIWRNPNDTAILLTAKWYARYERAGILESAMCVANSQSTKKEFEQWYEDTTTKLVADSSDVLYGTTQPHAYWFFAWTLWLKFSVAMIHSKMLMIISHVCIGCRPALRYSSETNSPVSLACRLRPLHHD